MTGAKAEAVVRFAEAGIARAANELVNRRAVAVGAVEIAVAVPAKAEGVHLTVRPWLNARTVGSEAEDVAAVEFERAAVLRLKVTGVVEAMRGIHPAIQAEAEAAAHAVGVFFVAERPEEDLAMVSDVIAIGVGEIPDVRNAPSDAAGFVLGFVPGEDAGGDVEFVGEVGDFVGFAIAVRVFEDLDSIAAVFDAGALRIGPAAFVGGVGILDGGGDPQTSTGIEGHVDGLVDLRLAGEELDFEAWRDVELGLFFRRRQRLRFTHQPRVSSL
jgi:hypothetical protein